VPKFLIVVVLKEFTQPRRQIARGRRLCHFVDGTEV